MTSPFVSYDAQRLERVCQELGLQLVILYGSRSTGTPPPGPESDVDLALVGRSDGSLEWWGAASQALSDVFAGYEVDVVLLRQADPLFRYEILSGGTLLYGEPLDFLEYKAFAYRDFMDSADLRALEETLFHKKMAFISQELHGAP